jgi:hypothetical protein
LAAVGPVIARCPVRHGGERTDADKERGMSGHDGQQKGAQEHAEGQHGEKTHERFREQISEFRDTPDPTQPEGTPHREGRHRLDEDRQQHDDADLQSERNRERR